MEGFLEVVTHKLKETPEGEGGERKGADGSARGGGFTHSLALLEARNPVVVFLMCPGWDPAGLGSMLFHNPYEGVLVTSPLQIGTQPDLGGTTTADLQTGALSRCEGQKRSQRQQEFENRSLRPHEKG